MIPKTIHYCWFGGNPKPKSVIKCINSWKKYCPDYEIIEWNEDNYDISSNQYMKEAYEAKRWAFASDYARVDIMYNHGGIYLDTDVQVIKSFDPLLKSSSFFGFEDDGDGLFYIGLGLGFAAEKGNKLVKNVMDSYKDLSFINPDGSLNMIPSPQLNTKIFIDNGFLLNNTKQQIDGNVVYPGDYFDPKNFNTGIMTITDNTYSIHHYDASWYDEGDKKKIKEQWKQEKRKHRKNVLRYLPQIVTKKLLGEKKYKKLKTKLKK